MVVKWTRIRDAVAAAIAVGALDHGVCLETMACEHIAQLAIDAYHELHLIELAGE